jgi:hypothetical protein
MKSSVRYDEQLFQMCVNLNCACPYLIKQQAMKTYLGVGVYIQEFFSKQFEASDQLQVPTTLN